MSRVAACLCGPRRSSSPRFFAADAARVARSDPTGTLPLVRRWSRDLDARWNTIKRILPMAVKDRANPVNMISHSVLTGKGDPVTAFQSWLDEAMRQIVLGTNGSWLLPYVRQAADQGQLHARSTTVGKDQHVGPSIVDRTHLLQSLAIAELQGIVEAVSQQLVRALANGLLSRQSPTTIAGSMRAAIDAVGMRRGHLLISFMTVKAFNSSALDGFRALGVIRVGLVPERTVTPAQRIGDAKPGRKSLKGKVNVITAEDDRVCPECEEIAADGPYYIDEAEHLIPAHPRCRCAFVPADPKEREEVLGDAWSDKAREAALEARRRKWSPEQLAEARKEGHDRIPHVIPMSEHLSDVLAMESFYEGRRGSKVEQVQFKNIRATQKTVSENYTPEHGAANKDHPVGIEYKGKVHIIDGHHRLDAYMSKPGAHPYVTVRVHKHDAKNAAAFRAWRRENMDDSATHIASGVMITADNTGRTLFLRRAGTGDEKGTWAFPGGAVESGETVEQAAARETREEIGYEPDVNDLEQVHRHQLNGVDFTTYEHSVATEFRPHLNHEHDAHKWAYLSQAPQPLHPGVASTLADMWSRRVGTDDENWTEELHPRDKDGKFTTKGSGPHHALAFDPEPNEALSSPKPAEHPLQKHLSFVSGTSAERMTLRKQMQSASGDALKELQARHNASFWKQHQQLTKAGKLDAAKEIASKLDKYSKTYGISNPLKSPPPTIQSSVAASAAKPVFGKAAPKPATVTATPHAELTFSSLKKVGEQKGSNPGGVYEDVSGNQYYVKTMSKERADNELLAAKLYKLAGANTLEYVPVKPDGDSHYVATKFEKLDKDNVSKLSLPERHQAQKDFATHAWLANWDAAGTGGDNQGVKNGVVKTLDVGGALEFRAKGTPKGEAFGKSVEEWNTLRSADKNMDSAMLFKSMTTEQLKTSVDKLSANVTAADIRNTVESVYGVGTVKSKTLADKLIDRKTDLVQRADALTAKAAVPKTKEQYDVDVLKAVNGYIPSPAAVAQFNKANDLDLSVAQLGALQSYIGSSYKGLNKELRKTDGQSLDIIKFAKVFDEALAKMPIHEGYTQRGIDNDHGGKIFKKYAENVGKVVTETQFTSAGIKNKLWGSTTLHIQSKSARSLTMMNSEGGGEVVFRKGTHLHITKVNPDTREIWAEEV